MEEGHLKTAVITEYQRRSLDNPYVSKWSNKFAHMIKTTLCRTLIEPPELEKNQRNPEPQKLDLTAMSSGQRTIWCRDEAVLEMKAVLPVRARCCVFASCCLSQTSALLLCSRVAVNVCFSETSGTTILELVCNADKPWNWQAGKRNCFIPSCHAEHGPERTRLRCGLSSIPQHGRGSVSTRQALVGRAVQLPVHYE